jgi:hypothetical protein
MSMSMKYGHSMIERAYDKLLSTSIRFLLNYSVDLQTRQRRSCLPRAKTLVNLTSTSRLPSTVSLTHGNFSMPFEMMRGCASTEVASRYLLQCCDTRLRLSSSICGEYASLRVEKCRCAEVG